MKKDMRDSVGEFYSKAARQPAGELCCASSYDGSLASHIPPEVLEVSYGCGSPVTQAALAEGETLVDLGSGGGVDCFLAAKLVGGGGRVIGVDMTEEMLERARGAAPKVAENLGFDVVEFRKGFLEEIPVEDGAADVVTSNCVVNLAGDKELVFREIWRILGDGGRLAIADVVAEGDVPEGMRADERLWSECVSGALREDLFLAAARKAGFYGMEVVSRVPYRVVEGLRFNSVVVRGYKLAKGAECVYRGQKAVYNGPFSEVSDDEGHTFAAGVAVEICTDTAERLSRAPYRDMFTIIEPDREGSRPCEPGCC